MTVTGPKLTTYGTAQNEEFRFKSGYGLLAEPDPDQENLLNPDPVRIRKTSFLAIFNLRLP
jgi:hypothetical protein